MEIRGLWGRERGVGREWTKVKGLQLALLPAAQCFPGSLSSAPVTQVHLCKEQPS